MNAIELLKKDHRTVKSLFESFEKAKEKDEGTSKAELFASIKEELDVHARVEEEIFYPAFDGAAKEEDDKELVLEAGEEHKQVKTLLAELEELGPDDDTFDAKMKVLKDNVEHHVEEEEGEMFPHAQKQLGSERLEELGQQIAARKEQLLAQPGRSAGRSASGSPASRTRAAAPGRRSGRKADGETSGTGMARASGSNPSERRESMGSDEESPRSVTPSRRSSRSSSSGRSRSSSSGRTRSSSSRGRSTGRSASGTRTSSSRGASSRGGARKTGARAASSRGGRSSSSGRSGSSRSSRGGSSSRRGSSGRRGSSSGSRGRGRSART